MRQQIFQDSKGENQLIFLNVMKTWLLFTNWAKSRRVWFVQTLKIKKTSTFWSKLAKITRKNLKNFKKCPKWLILTLKLGSTSFHQQMERSNSCQSVTKSLLSDTTVGNFGENASFNTFSPVFWSKITIFGRKMAFSWFLIFICCRLVHHCVPPRGSGTSHSILSKSPTSHCGKRVGL